MELKPSSSWIGGKFGGSKEGCVTWSPPMQRALIPSLLCGWRLANRPGAHCMSVELGGKRPAQPAHPLDVTMKAWPRWRHFTLFYARPIAIKTLDFFISLDQNQQRLEGGTKTSQKRSPTRPDMCTLSRASLHHLAWPTALDPKKTTGDKEKARPDGGPEAEDNLGATFCGPW